MTDTQKICDGISKAALGYFFIYFDFKLNTVSIIPAFVGYLLFLSAINILKSEEKTMSLIYTIGVILAVWHSAQWVTSFFGTNLDGRWQFVDIVIGVINLYFHFQLLTNLASVAKKYSTDDDEQGKQLLGCRTLQTIILSGIMIITNFSPWLSEIWGLISVGLAIVYIIAGVIIIKALHDLNKAIGVQDEDDFAHS